MTTILDVWSAMADRPSATPILPDGCRDLICRIRAGQAPFWFISPLQSRPIPSIMRTGDCLTGFRLTPGTNIAQATLLQAVQGQMPEPDRIGQTLIRFTNLNTSLTEALTCLDRSATIQIAARDLGVSMRSLQRLIRRETNQTPGFWHGLARVRHAARLLNARTPLAEAAFTAGYADQAHMSRAFRRWFGVTPRGFLADPRLNAQAASVAYG